MAPKRIVRVHPAVRLVARCERELRPSGSPERCDVAHFIARRARQAALPPHGTPVSRLPAIWWELMLTEGAQTVRKVFAEGRYHCIELRMRLRYELIVELEVAVQASLTAHTLLESECLLCPV